MQITKSKRKLYRGQRAQSLVELAVALPVMVLILLGTIDFGMAIFSYAILRDAAQEGALYGSFNPNNKAEIENRARNISPRAEDAVFSSPINLRDTSLVTVNVKALGASCQGSTKGAANGIQVSVSYNYPLIMPFIRPIVGAATIPLTGAATNIILQPPCK
jgi:Flp pilus assembly protein TadG